MTAELVESELLDVITKEGMQKVTAIVTDNGKNMVSAVKNITSCNERIIGVRCSAHVFNLLIQDIAKTKSVNICLRLAKEVVKEIITSKAKKGWFKEEWHTHLQDNMLPNTSLTLSVNAATRWYSIHSMLAILVKAKAVLRKMAIRDPTNKNLVSLSSETRKYILKDKFWTQVKTFKDMFELLIKAIACVESNNALLSDAVNAFFEVRDKLLNDTKLREYFPHESERNIVLMSFTKRCSTEFISEYHLVAFYLDPRFREYSLPEETVFSIMTTLEDYARKLGFIACERDKDDIADALCDFRERKKIFSCSLLSTSDPNRFWKRLVTYNSVKKLAMVACRLFSIPASSAGVERNFSIQGKVHSKDRNRLSKEKVERLMKVKWYLSLNPDIKLSYEDVDDNSDCDIDSILEVDDAIENSDNIFDEG
ncbi:uncharacterized protein B4U80_11953 [Leptotrombidium deliense]|uniref:HAT C-terminal dimerisation domain-containing protein n=1 Tax=Leptotrombidium deliense TaxID=299467 RepID=A0A443S0G7_9ACAR|nr:uncharacterized protein B4U80_11953 [Leptotrombidium deliense]